MADQQIEFLLDGPDALRRAQAVVARAAPAFWAKGEPLRLSLTAQEQTNTLAQKRYLNGPILDAIATQARWDGQQYPREFWKEFYRRMFLLRDEYITPHGEVLPLYWSTGDKKFSVRLMGEFIDKVKAHAVMEWGVVFDE